MNEWASKSGNCNYSPMAYTIYSDVVEAFVGEVQLRGLVGCRTQIRTIYVCEYVLGASN